MKYNIHDILLTLPLPTVLRRTIKTTFFKINKTYANLPYGERLRLALIELGPIYVKLGQILSTRTDLLHKDTAKSLAKLQDQVPGFCGNEAVNLIESAFEADINDLFLDFNTTPIASASVAQVHEAVTIDGDVVVVKILRPNIKKLIDQDIQLIETMANLAFRFSATAKRLKVTEVVSEIKKSIYNELDLVREAANASQLRRNFDNSELLYVPKIYWDYSKTNIMVMEKLSGIPISDIETLKAKNVNLKKLSEVGVEIFFTQVFRDCFFHADMHPGNVWADITDPQNPHYLALDFGIIGTLNTNDQRYLAENFLAFFNRDYKRVAQLHIESNWVPPNTRVDEFESAIRSVCEPIFEKPLKDISFGKTLFRLFQTAKSFNMEIQPQLILLQKTLINIEGLGRQLYPDLDLWSTAKPFLEKWMKARIGPKAMITRIKNLAPYWMEIAPEMPQLAYNMLKKGNAPQQPVKKNRGIMGLVPSCLFIILVTVTLVMLKDKITSPSVFAGLCGLGIITSYLFGYKSHK